MKKEEDAKMRFFAKIILVVFIASAVIGISDFINKKNESKIIPINEELTAKSYVDYVENHPIDIGEVGCSYTYDEYTIENFGRIIIIGKNGENDKDTRQMIVGSDFVLTKNKIWFINTQRAISAFDFTEYDFSNDFPYDYLKSSAYHEYENADINDNLKVDRWVHHWKDSIVFDESHLIVKNDEVIADTNEFSTVLFEGRKIVIYKKREIMKEIKLPFYLKEIAYLCCENGSTYEFINSNDAVGTIKIWDLGYSISMVDETPKERHLFSSPKDYILKIRVDEDYAIYYEEGILMGGNANMHFSFENLPTKVIVIGDFHGDGGIGKGINEACFATGYKDESLDEYLEKARKVIDF